MVKNGRGDIITIPIDNEKKGCRVLVELIFVFLYGRSWDNKRDNKLLVEKSSMVEKDILWDKSFMLVRRDWSLKLLCV